MNHCCGEDAKERKSDGPEPSPVLSDSSYHIMGQVRRAQHTFVFKSYRKLELEGSEICIMA